MSLRRGALWIGIFVAGAIGVLMVIGAGLVALAIPIDLSGLRGHIQAAATAGLGREVTIEGPIALVPGAWPTIRVEGIAIANPAGWPSSDLLHLDYARLRFGILPLLAGRIEIAEVVLVGLDVALLRAEDGTANWHLGDVASANAPGERNSDSLWSIALGELAMRDVVIRYTDQAAAGATQRMELTEVGGSAGHDEPLRLRARADDLPWLMIAEGGSLAELLAPTEPWPLQLTADVAGATLEVVGTIAEPLRGRGLDLAIALEGEGLNQLERLVEAPLPQVRRYRLLGHLVGENDQYRLLDVQGATDVLALEGDLAVDLAGERPRLSGRLHLPSVDAAPWVELLRQLPKDAAEEDQVARPEALELDRPVWTPTALGSLDGELELTVGEIAGVPGGIRDVSLAISVQDGGLDAPIALTLAEVGFTGRLVLAAKHDTLGVDLDLEAAASDIGALAQLIGAEGIEGRFEKADLALTGRGATNRSLIESLELVFGLHDAAFTYGNQDGGEPVEVTLEAARVILPPRQRLQVVSDGMWLSEPFRLDFLGGDMAELLSDEGWPVVLSAWGGGAALRLEGGIAALEDESASRFRFALAGDSIGRLARWLPVAPAAEASYAISGEIVPRPHSWHLQELEAQLGQTRLSGTLSAAVGQDVAHAMQLEVEHLDAAELGLIFAEADQEPAAPAFTIDVPVLPRDLSFEDADIDLTIRSLAMETVDIVDVAFSSRIRDGRVGSSPFEATVAGARFEGQLALDLLKELPRAAFTVAAEPIDLGRLLAQVGVADDLELSAERLALELSVEGDSVREMAARASLSADLRDGRWTVHDPSLRDHVDIDLSSGLLRASPGQPTTLRLEGAIGASPVEIDIQSDDLATLVDPAAEISLSLSARAAGAELELAGRTPKPVELDDFHAELSLTGEHLDGLGDLLGFALSPLGPYALQGDFGTNPTGYHVGQLDLRLGGSRLTGDLDLETNGERPRLVAGLVSPTLQLNDLLGQAWPPLADDTEQGVVPQPPAETIAPDPMEEPGVWLRRFDASIDLEIEQVLAGAEPLGGLELGATLEDGRLALAPVHLTTAGGGVDASLMYQPTAEGVMVEARVDVDQLDLGILARRLDPKTDFGGLISLDLDLRSRAQSLEEMMAGADGQVGVALWPEHLAEDVFDVWASNLLVEVLSTVDTESEAEFNCIVARATAADGVFDIHGIFIDSTRIQVLGEGEIDWRSGTIDLSLAPRTKTAKLFSIATPVHVTGPLDHPDIEVGAGDLVTTVVRLYYTMYVYLLESIFGGTIPPTDEAACAEAWAWRPEG